MLNLKNLPAKEVWLGIENKPAFFLCIFIASLMWLLNALGEVYNHKMEVEVKYLNFPSDKTLQKPVPKKLDLYFEATGSELFRKQLSRKAKTLSLDLQYIDDSNSPIISYPFLSKSITEQLFIDGISAIEPNLINLDFIEAFEKKVKLKANSQLEFIDGLHGLKEIVLNPDSIFVKGPKNVMDTLRYWYTDTIQKKEINKNSTGSISLEGADLFNFELSREKVNYTIKVEKFTEKTFNIPIRPINLADSLSVILYPKMANLSIKVGFTDFDEVEASAFDLVVDFKDVDITKQQKLRVISQKEIPKSISNLRFSPEYVEFIVYKK